MRMRNGVWSGAWCTGTRSSVAATRAGTPAAHSPQSAPGSSARARDGGPASNFFSQHLLQNMAIERQIGHHALEPRVLFLEHAQLAQLGHAPVGELLLPD